MGASGTDPLAEALNAAMAASQPQLWVPTDTLGLKVPVAERFWYQEDCTSSLPVATDVIADHGPGVPPAVGVPKVTVVPAATPKMRRSLAFVVTMLPAEAVLEVPSVEAAVSRTWDWVPTRPLHSVRFIQVLPLVPREIVTPVLDEVVTTPYQISQFAFMYDPVA